MIEDSNGFITHEELILLKEEIEKDERRKRFERYASMTEKDLLVEICEQLYKISERL